MGPTDALRGWCSYHAGKYRGMEGRACVDRRENRRGHRRLVQISRREKPSVTKSLAMDLRRIVLLGHSGFVGSHIVTHLSRHRPDLELVALSVEDLDRARRGAVERLSALFGADVGVVMTAGVKRKWGDP